MTELLKDFQYPDWIKHPTLDLYIRSTISYRGPVIIMNGSKAGQPEFSPRRYSVVDAQNAVTFKVITLSYSTPFPTSSDYPIHTKYLEGECLDLMSIEYPGTLEEALTWDGCVQELEGFFR